MHYPMTASAVLALAIASCAPESVSGPEEAVSSDLAADTENSIHFLGSRALVGEELKALLAVDGIERVVT